MASRPPVPRTRVQAHGACTYAAPCARVDSQPSTGRKPPSCDRSPGPAVPVLGCCGRGAVALGVSTQAPRRTRTVLPAAVRRCGGAVGRGPGRWERVRTRPARGGLGEVAGAVVRRWAALPLTGESWARLAGAGAVEGHPCISGQRPSVARGALPAFCHFPQTRRRIRPFRRLRWSHADNRAVPAGRRRRGGRDRVRRFREAFRQALRTDADGLIILLVDPISSVAAL